jgi:hypothetical protein
MKRSSKSGHGKGYDATGDYYAVEHYYARHTLERGMPEPQRHIHMTSHELIEQTSQQSAEAQAFAEIALAFCRECRGVSGQDNRCGFGQF